jgi:hypothetical protein
MTFLARPLQNRGDILRKRDLAAACRFGRRLTLRNAQSGNGEPQGSEKHLAYEHN